ncbi:hypothetical protein EYF80_030836 [Liparis tanakae]|uniref:Uncharacterized protein n=1 Tax=Liparis tanakae TaxID=230148 RepID=A0A4Z2H1G4_9TELE|nr:hypothetical protein EYF80_030836 [Liparis tanakae]
MCDAHRRTQARDPARPAPRSRNVQNYRGQRVKCLTWFNSAHHFSVVPPVSVTRHRLTPLPSAAVSQPLVGEWSRGPTAQSGETRARRGPCRGDES